MFAVATKSLSSLRSIAYAQSVRSISTTGNVMDIFKIQSQEDFDEKVKNSKGPVIVDFFAT